MYQQTNSIILTLPPGWPLQCQKRLCSASLTSDKTRNCERQSQVNTHTHAHRHTNGFGEIFLRDWLWLQQGCNTDSLLCTKNVSTLPIGQKPETDPCHNIGSRSIGAVGKFCHSLSHSLSLLLSLAISGFLSLSLSLFVRLSVANSFFFKLQNCMHTVRFKE